MHTVEPLLTDNSTCRLTPSTRKSFFLQSHSFTDIIIFYLNFLWHAFAKKEIRTHRSSKIILTMDSSGAPAVRRAAKRSPILIMQGKDKGNP